MPSTLSKAKTLSIQALAQAIAGAQVLGNTTAMVSGLSHPLHVKTPHEMAYIGSAAAWACFDAGVRLGVAEANLAIPPSIQQQLDAQHISLLQVPRGRVALAILLDAFERPTFIEAGIHPQAHIHPSAQVHATAQIGPFASVGPEAHIGAHVRLHANAFVGAQAQVGEGSILHAGCYIGDRCTLGKHCVIQPNAVIGGDGFSYVTPEAARHEKQHRQQEGSYQGLIRINSVGNVVLEDRVEVGACSCIDRGTLAETRIAAGTKIDNLVQIGHNNRIGEDCLIVSQVGISGSCNIGHRVVIAGQTGVADHLNIGDDVIIMARSGVMKDVEAKSTLLGAPAMPHKVAMANIAAATKLRDMVKEAKEIKQQLQRFQALADKVEPLLAQFNETE